MYEGWCWEINKTSCIRIIQKINYRYQVKYEIIWK